MLRNLRGILTICVLTFILAIPTGWAVPAQRASPPPADGDWIVNDATSVSDTVILLNGSLIIQAGGNLSLTNVTLIMNCSSAGQFRIEVRSGGEFVLRACNLTAAGNWGYQFWALSGSRINLANSEIHGAGTGSSNNGTTDGMLIRTSAASFLNVSFSSNFDGLHIRDCSPRITNCTFSGNENGIVAYNSSLQLSGNTFSGNNISGLSLRDRTNITVTGCNFSTNRQFGVYINTSSVNVTRNSFWRNNFGVQAEYSALLTIANNDFSRNDGRGVSLWYCNDVRMSENNINNTLLIAFYAMASRVSAVNCSFNGSMNQMYLDGGSVANLLNCTVEKYYCHFDDYTSRLNVSWFLNTRVLWWSNESPVSGASVSAFNGTGNLSFTGKTDAQGVLGWGVARDFVFGRMYSQLFGPYSVNASRDGRFTSQSTNVNQSFELEILLDDLGPLVSIGSPPNGSFINTSNVTITGSASDNETGVVAVELKLDNGTWFGVQGTSKWNATVGLSDGNHTVYARGKDTANNTRTLSSRFTVDTLAPVFNISTPDNGTVTRESQLPLMGIAELCATIAVNGTVVPLDNVTGGFGTILNLTEGNNIITVGSYDRALNYAEKTFVVRLDTQIQPFDIGPANGTWCNRSNITISGKLEENVNLTIRSLDATNSTITEVNLTITDGNVSVNWELSNGTNRIQILATDPYNNSWSDIRYYYLDLIAPYLNLSSPALDECWTRERRLVITGVTEQYAALYINGKPALTENGNFSKAVTLDLYDNVFNITAVDQAGNSRSVQRTVHLDRIAPWMNITAPRSGTRTADAKIVVRGTTEENATVYINGRKVKTTFFSRGVVRFSYEMNLKLGNNTIRIEAYDRAGNYLGTQRLVTREPPAPLLTDQQAVLVAGLLIIGGIIAYVAYDTKKNTGRWGLRRPGWLRVPDRMREYLPSPTYGREEYETGASAVPAAAGQEGKQPQNAGGAPPPPLPAPPAPGAIIAPQPAFIPAPAGNEYAAAEKPGAPPSVPVPGATELSAQSPPDTAGGGPVTARPEPQEPAEQAPAPPEQPPEPPAPPPEPDPLGDILGSPTRKV